MKYLLIRIAAALIDPDEVGIPGPRSDAGVLSGVLSAVYFWAGVIAVGMIIYGGFSYVLSNGEPGNLKKAKDTILYSVIGLVVVLVAFAITNFVIKGVNGA